MTYRHFTQCRLSHFILKVFSYKRKVWTPLGRPAKSLLALKRCQGFHLHTQTHAHTQSRKHTQKTCKGSV